MRDPRRAAPRRARSACAPTLRSLLASTRSAATSSRRRVHTVPRPRSVRGRSETRRPDRRHRRPRAHARTPRALARAALQGCRAVRQRPDHSASRQQCGVRATSPAVRCENRDAASSPRIPRALHGRQAHAREQSTPAPTVRHRWRCAVRVRAAARRQGRLRYCARSSLPSRPIRHNPLPAPATARDHD